MMSTVEIEIVRFVADHQPGWVECILVDAFGQSHSFIEKVPVVTTERLSATSTYPQIGHIACEILAEWMDQNGQSLVKVNTERPYGIELSTGLTEFIVEGSKMNVAEK